MKALSAIFTLTNIFFLFFIQQKIISTPHQIFTQRPQARMFTVILHLHRNRPENRQNHLKLFISREVERH